MDTLGDYMKSFERAAETRAVKGQPLCARLDGRAFHTFTKGLKRPYDKRLTDLMMYTTMTLVRETNPILGYTQSDEITLVWYVPEDSPSQYLFDGRFQKLASILAGIATGEFRSYLKFEIPEKADAAPVFDCRVWQVPTLNDAVLMFKWRELDAIKNSISMAAQAHFSHKQLHQVGSEDKKRMLREIGHPWEDEPEFFKRGSYFRRETVEVQLTAEELERIPEKHRPTGPVLRTVVSPVKLPLLTDMKGEEAELFPTL